jgi:hypothetical protein
MSLAHDLEAAVYVVSVFQRRPYTQIPIFRSRREIGRVSMNWLRRSALVVKARIDRRRSLEKRILYGERDWVFCEEPEQRLVEQMQIDDARIVSVRISRRCDLACRFSISV